MSEKSKRIMAIFTGLVVFAFAAAFIAIGAYNLGRQSAKPAVQGSDDLNSISAPLPGTEAARSNLPDPDTLQDAELSDADSSQPSNEESEIQVDALETSSQDKAQSEQSETEEVQRMPVDLDEVDTELLLEVWEIINREFDGTLPSSEDVTYHSIIGSMDLLNDQYSRFIPPDLAERTRIQIQGGYEGIGAYVDMTDDGNLMIVRPIDGQPADEAGILAGDVVLAVDGQSITGMPLAEIVSLVTGPQGSDVTLTIFREDTGETLEFTITRQLIDFPLVSSEMLDDKIAYVRLTSFSNGAEDQLAEAIESLLKQDPVGLIFDLRDNPGGLLSESIEVSDLFLPEGIVAYQRDSKENETVFESENGDLAETIPLVILVNQGSASGSEIVAGAIDDRERGVLIGETTLGKGSVQQSYTLSDGSELRVTIAKWYTPNNETITGTGIEPDILVDTPVDLGGEEDTQLQRAIDFLLESR